MTTDNEYRLNIASLDAEQSNWSLIKRLLEFSWQFKAHCIQLICLQIVLLAIGLSGLGLTGLGIDYLRFETLPGESPPRWPFGLVPPVPWSPIAVMLAIALSIVFLALIRSFLNYIYTTSMARLVSAKIVANLRSRVYDKLQRLSFRFFDANASGTLINRVTSDVQSVRLFIDGVMVQVFIMVLSLGVYLAYMLNIHVGLTLACLATTPLLGFISVVFSRIVRPAYRENRRMMDELVLSVSEYVQGISAIKAFNLEDHTVDRYGRATEAIRKQRFGIFFKVTTFTPLAGGLTQINLVLLLLYGGYLVIHQDLPIGTGIVVFAGLLQQFSGQVASMVDLADNVQQSLIGSRRVFEILDTPLEITSKKGVSPDLNLAGEIRFDNVSFRYGEAGAVLVNVDFKTRRGEVVAIAGATGSGKSALPSLIPRFYDPCDGRIVIDGVDLQDVSVTALRRNIGLVFQENFLFSTTVAENIAFGCPEASRDQIEKAARIAVAHDFIEELPQGYNTVLDEGGSNLSGGQRQRLSIARAVLLEPSILLLDDPTASVDPETEHEILDAIESAIQGRTTFIVAHRLSTLKRADRILVLQKGRIIQEGDHDTLVRQEGLYRDAVELQAVDPVSLRILEQNRKMQKTVA